MRRSDLAARPFFSIFLSKTKNRALDITMAIAKLGWTVGAGENRKLNRKLILKIQCGIQMKELRPLERSSLYPAWLFVE